MTGDNVEWLAGRENSDGAKRDVPYTPEGTLAAMVRMRKTIDDLQAQLATAHGLLREAINACEDSYENMGGETIYSYDSEEISHQWFERAKKEVGDE